jgi:hypothetical protein
MLSDSWYRSQGCALTQELLFSDEERRSATSLPPSPTKHSQCAQHAQQIILIRDEKNALFLWAIFQKRGDRAWRLTAGFGSVGPLTMVGLYSRVQGVPPLDPATRTSLAPRPNTSDGFIGCSLLIGLGSHYRTQSPETLCSRRPWLRCDAAHPTEVMPPPPFRTEAAHVRVSNSGFEFLLIDQRGGTPCRQGESRSCSNYDTYYVSTMMVRAARKIGRAHGSAATAACRRRA